MVHYERDLTGNGDENRDIFYPLVTGIGDKLDPDLPHSESNSSSDSQGESVSDSGSSGEENIRIGNPVESVRDRMSRDEWKVCKKAIKEQQREKRKSKIPKHVKRRKEKAGKRKK